MLIERLLFLDLLYAEHNIGGNAMPEEDDGLISTETALLMAEGKMFPSVADLEALDLHWTRDEGTRESVVVTEGAVRAGILVFLELYVDLISKADPTFYAMKRVSNIFGTTGWNVGGADATRKRMMGKP